MKSYRGAMTPNIWRISRESSFSAGRGIARNCSAISEQDVADARRPGGGRTNHPRPPSVRLEASNRFPYPKVDGSAFRPELQAKLDRVAADNRRGVGEYVQQLVESYLDHDAWFQQKVTAGLAKLDCGEYLSH